MKASALRRAVYALISACMVLYSVGVLAEEELEVLVVYHQALSSMSADTGPATIAEHEVTVNTWGLARSERHAAEFLLPDGSRFRAVPEEIRYRGDWRTDFAWHGKLESDGEEGWAVITVHQGHIAGLLSFSGRHDIELKPGPEPGIVRLLEVDSSKYPGCGVEHEPEEEFDSSLHTASLPQLVPASAGSAPIIDVMVVYTPMARQQAEGHAQIQAAIQGAVDRTNVAYADSEVYQRIELVRMQQVNYSGDQNGASSFDQRDWVTNDGTVASLRDQYQADSVALISGEVPGLCGRAHVLNSINVEHFESFAFSVTERSCLGGYIFAHELGHNMGLQHSPDDPVQPPEIAIYPWSYGHWFELPSPPNTWRAGYTIMTYWDACPEWCTELVPQFSNPNLLHDGVPTGIAGARDNARTLNLTANYIAGFRQGNWLYADRFEDRGYALSGITVPPPLTQSETCAELNAQLTLYEARLAEQAEELDEDGEDAWQQRQDETEAVAEIRKQVAEYCE